MWKISGFIIIVNIMDITEQMANMEVDADESINEGNPTFGLSIIKIADTLERCGFITKNKYAIFHYQPNLFPRYIYIGNENFLHNLKKNLD